MESNKKLMRNKSAAWQQVEENIIVVTGKTRKMHILDGVGYRIWEIMDNPVTKEDITGIISSEFDADTAQIEKDVDEFLDALAEKSVINVLE